MAAIEVIPKRIITQFPFTVQKIEHLWIPLRDGTRLAARMWMPAGADQKPVPAILEYIPYRKRDGTRMRDEPMHGFFSGTRLRGGPGGHARLRRIGRPDGRREPAPGNRTTPWRSSTGSAARSGARVPWA